MAEEPLTKDKASQDSDAAKSEGKKIAQERRQIPGNLPYLPSHGTLKRILDRSIELAKPDKFNYDFLENVVKITGGAARACIPIMKKMEFLNSDNTTTELYAKFRTEGGRSFAAYQGLRNAFPEIFKRSDYAYNIEDSKLRDIIVEITGLKANDSVAQAIKGTFLTIRGYISSDFNHADIRGASQSDTLDEAPLGSAPHEGMGLGAPSGRNLGISYNINIVLPETSDLAVLNAIFKSLKENLLS